jgi:hypothetical protein
MRILHIERHGPPPLARLANPSPPTFLVPPQILEDSILQTAPIDLRKLGNQDLPDTPDLESEEKLMLPLMPFVGARIETANTPREEHRRDIERLISVADRLSQPKSAPPEFHVSDRLLPTTTHKFGPENLYTESRIVAASRDQSMMKPSQFHNTRPFPYEMFKPGVIGVMRRSRVHSSVRTTFAQ